ncbi:MAG: TatD family hydrolase [bacterium]
MIARYIDTHCHLQLKQYDHDREEIIAQMREKGIIAIVIGDDLKSSKEAVSLAEKNEGLYASVGLHPSHASFDSKAFLELAKHPKVVAVGECGLEYFNSKIDKDTQKDIFKKHIALAVEFNKPLVIHARSNKTDNAYLDLISILKEEKAKYPNLRGVVHFFAGTLEEAKEFFALGFVISFTAVITFAHEYDAIIRTVPLANILSETDAPYVAPVSRRGQRNDPLAVIEVVRQIATIRGEDLETVRATLLANAEYLLTH